MSAAGKTIAGAAASERAGKPARRRVFFALWPGDTVRRDLSRATRTAVRRSGGRATPPGNLHITLAFLGPLTEADLATVVRVPPIPSREFTIGLDKLGHWSRSRVLWLGASRAPAELLRLERGLWDALVAAGFERERRPYSPHVTLARKARSVSLDIDTVAWPVSELALVESRPGARHPVYEVLRIWKLRGAG